MCSWPGFGPVGDLKIQLEDEVCSICKRRAAKAAKADAGNEEAREGGSDSSNPRLHVPSVTEAAEVEGRNALEAEAWKVYDSLDWSEEEVEEEQYNANEEQEEGEKIEVERWNMTEAMENLRPFERERWGWREDDDDDEGMRRPGKKPRVER